MTMMRTRCTEQNRRGEHCKKWAEPGRTVCRYHTAGSIPNRRMCDHPSIFDEREVYAAEEKARAWFHDSYPDDFDRWHIPRDPNERDKNVPPRALVGFVHAVLDSPFVREHYPELHRGEGGRARIRIRVPCDTEWSRGDIGLLEISPYGMDRRTVLHELAHVVSETKARALTVAGSHAGPEYDTILDYAGHKCGWRRIHLALVGEFFGRDMAARYRTEYAAQGSQM